MNKMKTTLDKHITFTVSLSLALCLLIGTSHNVNAQFVVFNNGAEVTVSQGCIVQINSGELNNDDGTIDNAGRITVDGNLINSDLLTGGGSSTGIFSVSGDWENNAVFNADQSLVNLNGANQLVTGTFPTGFYDLNLLGTGIKTLDVDASVLGVLELNNLEFATDNNTLQVLNTSSTAITENGGFVSSTGNGRLSWAMNSTDMYVFPLGSSAGTPRIRPLAITPTAVTPNTFAARLANNSSTTDGFDASALALELCSVNDLFYNQIDHISGADPVDITQYFVLVEDGDWANGAHWQGTTQWEDMTGTALGVSGGYSTVTNASWTNFSNPAFALSNILPEVSIDAVAPLCEQSIPVSLSATPLGGTYSGDGVSSGMFDPASAGGGSHTVTYTYTNGFGCTNSAELEIVVGDEVVVEITSSNNSLELCDGESLDLNATTGYVSYEWNTTEQSESITVNSNGQYFVTVEDANGCVGTSAIANITVQPNPEPIVTGNGPLVFCEGENVLLSTAANQGGYLWEGTNGTNPTTVVWGSGDYFVTVTNAFGCIGVSNSVTVDVTPMDEAFINENGNQLTVDPPGSGYQWFLNGDPIPGATGIDYDAIQSGNYHVEYIGPNGCPTSTYVLEFTLQTGVEEYSIFDVLDLYPNPGKGQFTIRGLLPTMEDVTIELTNMLGQMLQPAVILNNTNDFTQPLDISKYANGLYFIRIQAADSSVTVRYIKS
ncbi:T9SS type A sorting domain-containing protein [Flavobacteriales bacterium]|nr:T9SS type A sorting domain-containing protein [Flavobacteriales bacterium]